MAMPWLWRNNRCHNGICFDCGVERLKERSTAKTGLYRWEEKPQVDGRT